MGAGTAGHRGENWETSHLPKGPCDYARVIAAPPPCCAESLWLSGATLPFPRNLRAGRLCLPARTEKGGPKTRSTERRRTRGKIANPCHSERSEESAFLCFQADKCRCFASLSMTAHFFTASKPFRTAGRQSRSLQLLLSHRLPKGEGYMWEPAPPVCSRRCGTRDFA
jgi:hypothetical protein